jgi:acyl-CoA thioester hydrolase
MSKPVPGVRAEYPHFLSINTRWSDNDVYGHVNNVVYYSYFDTVVNEYLVREGALDPTAGRLIGLVVQTHCSYFAPLAFPERIDAGLRAARIGNTSVRYEVAIFREDSEQAAAQGYFVHVYVDRDTRKPVALPQAFLAALRPLLNT